MRLIPFLLLFTCLGACAQDYTLKEKTTPGGKYYDPIFTRGHDSIMGLLKPLRLGVIKAHPGFVDSMRNWRDSCRKYADTTGGQRANQLPFLIYHKKREGYRDLIQAVWGPIADKLRKYNQSFHVVGDDWDQRGNKIEQ